MQHSHARMHLSLAFIFPFLEGATLHSHLTPVLTTIAFPRWSHHSFTPLSFARDVVLPMLLTPSDGGLRHLKLSSQ